MKNPIEKDKSLKNTVLAILEKERSLTAKQIYYTIKKNSSRHLTYQAVFKCIKEMEKKNMLVSENKAYKININWLFGMRESIEKKINSCFLNEMQVSTDFESPPELKVRVLQFLRDIGPKAETYLAGEDGTIVIVSGGGNNFGTALLYYLNQKGFKVNHIILDRFSKSSSLIKNSVYGRKLIVVDSGTHTGTTYKAVMDILNNVRKKYKIKDIKYAAYYDRAGIADWSCPNAYVGSEMLM